MKIEIPDEIVDLLMSEELGKAVDTSQELITELLNKDKLESYQQEDLEYYQELVDAARIVRRHYTVNQ